MYYAEKSMPYAAGKEFDRVFPSIGCGLVSNQRAGILRYCQPSSVLQFSPFLSYFIRKEKA